MTKAEQFAKELEKYFKENSLDDCTIIYYDNKRVLLGEYAKNGIREVQENIKVEDYLEYCNPNAISLAYEGMLYYAMDSMGKIYEEIDAMAEKYGWYCEFGHAWSCSFYEI